VALDYVVDPVCCCCAAEYIPAELWKDSRGAQSAEFNVFCVKHFFVITGGNVQMSILQCGTHIAPSKRLTTVMQLLNRRKRYGKGFRH